MDKLRILFLGDLVGDSGFQALCAGIASLKKDTGAHLVAVNGENIADGHGLTLDYTEKLLSLGIGVITTGNHIWQRNDIYPHLESETRILRPINYPPSVPGRGAALIDAGGISVGFVNVLGQFRMGMTVDCPYRTAEKAVRELRKHTKCVIVDFHAEDVREKEGMFHYLDGSVSAVLGTHTHVPTADERIMPRGTAVVSDVGMCGPTRSVIGIKPDLSIGRLLTLVPLRMKLHDTPAELNGVVVTLSPTTGRALSITRVRS